MEKRKKINILTRINDYFANYFLKMKIAQVKKYQKSIKNTELSKITERGYQKNAYTVKVRYFDLNLEWRYSIEDPEFPYKLDYDNHALQIRINDFPEEPLYSLIVDSEVICDFEKWPPNWKK